MKYFYRGQDINDITDIETLREVYSKVVWELKQQLAAAEHRAASWQLFAEEQAAELKAIEKWSGYSILTRT